MDVTEKSTFVFGDGNRKECTGKATFPLTIAGVDGDLGIHILDAEAPLLIGVDVLRRLGSVIDTEKVTIHFKKLGRDSNLISLPSGHFAIPLLRDAEALHEAGFSATDAE